MNNQSMLHKLTQEAQLPLREQGVSFVHLFHHNATLRHLGFFKI